MSIQIKSERCTGCGYCYISCPSTAIRLEIQDKVYPVIDHSACTSCGECLYSCPNNVFSAPELEAPPVSLNKSYDAIIIGGGIGGLMTGVGLAKAGLRVLLLEQLSFVGGKYTHLMHKNYAISTAAWTCPGPNSRIGKLCKKLGAEIDWVTIHDIGAKSINHWVVTKDGKRYRSTDEAQETIVGGLKGMAKVYRWMADMYNPWVRYPEDMTARQYIQKFVPHNEEYERYVQTIITYCFASQTVDTFSAMETKRAIVDAIEQMADWGTAKGGTAAIVSALKEAFLKNGGQIALRTRVDSICVKDNQAEGVQLADGRIIKSPIVIHNGGLNRFIRLVGEENLPEPYVNNLKKALPANVAALVLGTNQPLLGKDHSLLHTMGWNRTLNCYAPTFFDPKLAPEGHHLLDVFWVLEPPYNRKEEMEMVLQELREIFPNFDQAVEMIIPMFFTGSWTAEMAHRMGQSGSQRLDPQSPIKNLYLVGYDCIGYGMAGDIIPHGVEKALYLILNDPQYAPEDEKLSSKLNKWIKSVVLSIIALSKSISKSK